MKILYFGGGFVGACSAAVSADGGHEVGGQHHVDRNDHEGHEKRIFDQVLTGVLREQAAQQALAQGLQAFAGAGREQVDGDVERTLRRPRRIEADAGVEPLEAAFELAAGEGRVEPERARRGISSPG